MEPRIQYAKTSDGVSIAYWTNGDDGKPKVTRILAGDVKQVTHSATTRWTVL